MNFHVNLNSQDDVNRKGSGRANRTNNNDDLSIFDEDAENKSDEASAKIKASDDPKNIEKDILRYYYYIHNGIDTEHVAPLENIRIQNTLGKI